MKIIKKTPTKKSRMLFTAYLTTVFFMAFASIYLAKKADTSSTSDDSTQVESVAKEEVLSIEEQINVILSHKDVWLKEEVRMEESTFDELYADGPHYSLMDLDQDGYLELVAYGENRQSCPSFYEVTNEKCLKCWAAEGDLPQSEPGGFSIFDTTSKADCFYDSAQNKYYYIVQDKLLLCQDAADVSYLAMTPSDDRVVFRKIGRYTFDASKDGEYHYYDANGRKCKEAELTKYYLPMTKKTMYYACKAISKKESETLKAEELTETLWNRFLLRDDYRSEKENDLTDDIRHQFVSLSISMAVEYVEEIGEPEDLIRYAATDLDSDGITEVIIENQTKNTYCIIEDSDGDARQWNTDGKELASFTQDASSRIFWHTCTISEFLTQSYDLIADNLRESWLHF
ncbi:MAG: hypothetical protein NC293_11075 [Roseburia sp.]|nr:hypothetical protein [Roseburia sp.]